MTSFYIKRKNGDLVVVNANSCELRYVGSIHCMVESLKNGYVDVFEPRTGLLLYSGHKMNMKEELREKVSYLRYFLKSDESKRMRKEIENYTFVNIKEIYERLYKR